MWNSVVLEKPRHSNHPPLAKPSPMTGEKFDASSARLHRRVQARLGCSRGGNGQERVTFTPCAAIFTGSLFAISFSRFRDIVSRDYSGSGGLGGRLTPSSRPLRFFAVLPAVLPS